MTVVHSVMHEAGSSLHRQTYHRLSCALTPAEEIVHDDAQGYTDIAPKFFTSEPDRDRLVTALMTVLTQNNAVDLTDHGFKVLWSRREIAASSSMVAPQRAVPDAEQIGDKGRLVVTLVAVSPDGAITAKIEEGEGNDVAAAVTAFRRGVEIRLSELLDEIGDVTGEQRARSTVHGDEDVGGDAGASKAVEPPSYQDVKGLPD